MFADGGADRDTPNVCVRPWATVTLTGLVTTAGFSTVIATGYEVTDSVPLLATAVIE